MPRTKISKKRRVTSDSKLSDESNIEEIKEKSISMQIEEVNALIRDKIDHMNHAHKTALKRLKEMYNVLKVNLMSSGLGSKTSKEISDMDCTDHVESFKENQSGMMLNPQYSKPKSQRAVRKRSNSCNSRSTTKKNQVLRSSSCDRNVPPSASKLKTPCNREMPAIPLVTPKVNPNIPLSVLRRPRQGEFAMSISGSPLMVSSVTYDDVVSVNVPLPDGRVLSILPTEGMHATNLDLDDETRKQLRRLQSNLSKCLGK
ncbi:borealin [Planococcus citri]|uniref:borealin n=1 Tax=Planococcus citri TaxID=170843 RepID=UPI0031F7A629